MSLEENAIETNQINLRNKGLRNAGGKVHKGCVKDAFTKLSIGSIPSNYQSIIYHHEEKRGFGTSQKRFYSQQNRSDPNKADNQPKIEQLANTKLNASHSSKGYGPLIAKQKREWIKYPNSPGPGKYLGAEYTGKKSEDRPKRKCFTRQRQQFKLKQIQLNKENVASPGPGYYEPDLIEDSPGCKSAFITKELRDGYIPRSDTPGPGCYNSDSNAKDQSKEIRQAMDEELFIKLNGEKRPKSKLFLARKKPAEVPGPGHYEYEVPTFKPLYERIKISSNFMQTGKDRFNDSVDPIVEGKEGPNPFSYSAPSSFDKIEKKLIDLSCFMSESRRQPFAGVEQRLGPNLTNDIIRDRKNNFHFNIRGGWL